MTDQAIYIIISTVLSGLVIMAKSIMFINKTCKKKEKNCKTPEQEHEELVKELAEETIKIIRDSERLSRQ